MMKEEINHRIVAAHALDHSVLRVISLLPDGPDREMLLQVNKNPTPSNLSAAFALSMGKK